MDLNGIIKFLQEHNVRSIVIDYDTNSAVVTKLEDVVIKFKIDTDHKRPRRVECTYCDSRTCEC